MLRGDERSGSRASDAEPVADLRVGPRLASLFPLDMSFFIPSLAAAFRNVASATLANRRGHCVRCERTTSWVTDSSMSAYRCTSCGHDAIVRDA